MKTNHHCGRFVTLGRVFMLASACIATIFLPSCSQEDAALQAQLVEARAALDAKTKALEKAETDLAKSQNHSGGAVSSEEVAKLKARNSDLEEQLANARAQNAESGKAPKFDMDAMAAKLEDDLTVKAKQLRELIQKQTTGGKVDEISLKAISYPSEIVTPFSSSITFNMLMDTGKTVRLMFPVTADLSGVWSLPGPDAVQKAFEQAQSQPAQPVASSYAAPAVNGAGGGFPAAPAPAAPVANTGGGGASMRQVDGNTFVFNWGDGPAGAAPAQAQPRPAAAPAATAPVAAAPQAPAAAAPQQPAVPAAVMPVQRDVVIKFD